MSSLIKSSQISQQVPKVSNISELRTHTSHEGNFSELFFLTTDDQFYKYNPSDTTTSDNGNDVIINSMSDKYHSEQLLSYNQIQKVW